MNDVRWEGLTHAEIYERVQAGPGRGASLAVESAWSDTEALILRIEERLGAAVAQSGGGWTGAAGDAARTAVTPLGRWAADAAGDAKLTATGVVAQGEQAAWLRTAMPSPHAPLWDEPAGRPPSDPLYLLEDMQALEQRSAADTAQAVHLMNTYTGNSYENKRFMDYWTFPPSVTVETAGAAGTDRPGMPAVGSALPVLGPAGAGPGQDGSGPPGLGAAASGSVGSGAVVSGAASDGTGGPGAGTTAAGQVGGGRASTGGPVPVPPDVPAAAPVGVPATGSGAPPAGGRSRPTGGLSVPAGGRPGSGVPGRGSGAVPAGGRPPAAGATAPGPGRAPSGQVGRPSFPGGLRPVVPGPPSPSSPTPSWRDLVPGSGGSRVPVPPFEGGHDPSRGGGVPRPGAGGIVETPAAPGRGAITGAAEAEAAARSGGTRAVSSTHPGLYPPMVGAGVGGQDREHRRPDYLLDDGNAFADDRWFTPPVIAADDPLPPPR